MIATLYRMTSGECRWVGRPDIHVYCWAPCDLVMMPHGREGWQRRPPVFQIVTATATTDWLDAPTAAREIQTLLAQESRNVA